MVAPFLPDAEKLAAVREGLPALGAGLYFDTPVAGPLPAEAARAMTDLASWELTTGRAGRDRREEVLARIDEARGSVAAVLTAELGEVLLVHGLDDAVARAVRAIDWQAGQRVIHVWDGVAGADPAAWLPAGIVQARVDLPAEPEGALEAIDEALRAGARLVVCPAVSAMTGTLLPLPRIAALAHAQGAWLLVDASQAAGAVRLSRPALGADLLVARSEAWLLGPEGLAVLAGDAGLLERAAGPGDPVRGAAGSTDGDVAAGFHLPSVVGLARSCGWLSMSVGLPWIETRGLALARLAAERLAAIPGVDVVTPRGSMATLVVFRIAGWAATAALDELGARVFLLASAVRELDAIRIGAGFFNTEAEVDRLVGAVDLVAAHRPETLPPRRRLAIIGEEA